MESTINSNDSHTQKRRTKISIVSMNLSTNCTNRALRLAQALSSVYDVEIVGPTFGVGKRWGEGIWPPLERTSIPIKSVRGDYLPGFYKSIRHLLTLLDGDIIIACKPRFPSMGIALLKKMLTGKPVILDVDDDEYAQTMGGKKAPLTKKLVNTSGYLFTRITHPFWKLVDGVFTVSEHFRKYYGGIIVPHGQDPDALDPRKYDRNLIRAELKVANDEILIGFVGTPQRQKGIDLIMEAIESLENKLLKCMIVGADENDEYLRNLKKKYGSIMIVVPPQHVEKIPYYLTAFDIVALPQLNVPESQGQMPAKLTDAMAMAKIIIASEISDIPLYLNNRGLLVKPGELDALKDRIRWVINNKKEAENLGLMARQYFLDNLTLDAMLAAMHPVLERILSNHHRRLPKSRP